MPNLLESLIGSAAVRPDEKRLVPTRRPLPATPRDLFELFAAMGGEASLPSLFQSTQLHAAEPRALTYVALNRWPTEAELDALPAPYNSHNHLRVLLTGAEFRASLLRRICAAYPERPRRLFVRVPRCAGEHFLALAGQMHPVAPPDLAAVRRESRLSFLPELGRFLGGFTRTKTILLVQPRLSPFVEAPAAGGPAQAEAGLHWPPFPPLRRAGDRLFTILREPASLILSEVNAILDRLLQPAESDSQATAAWRRTLPQGLATADSAGRVQVGREILRRLTMRDPICHAFGDGTAAAAFRAVRLHDVELADLSRYADWVKYSWDVEAEPPANTSTPHLTLAQLGPAEHAHLDRLIAEDRRFYAPVRSALDRLEGLATAVRGRDL